MFSLVSFHTTYWIPFLEVQTLIKLSPPKISTFASNWHSCCASSVASKLEKSYNLKKTRYVRCTHCLQDIIITDFLGYISIALRKDPLRSSRRILQPLTKICHFNSPQFPKFSDAPHWISFGGASIPQHNEGGIPGHNA